MENKQPEKNCGNCARYRSGNCHLPGAVIQIQGIVKGCGDWQPKKPEPLKPERWPGMTPIAYDKEGNAVGFAKPEPQGWERELEQAQNDYGISNVARYKIADIIRQVAAEERDKEKEAIVSFLKREQDFYKNSHAIGALRYQIANIEQNRHRGEK